MRPTTRTARSLALAATLALGLAACGGDGDTDESAAPTADASSAADDMDMDGMDTGSEMDDMGDMDEMGPEDGDSEMDGMEMDDMDMDGMDMGSADGPRAQEADADELREGELVLLDSAPAQFADATGEAALALGPMTWLTVDVDGLEPGTEVVGHLHAESCQTSGGPHFKFDEDGEDVPPNEVHIAATADEDGSFTVSVTNDMVADGAMSVVVHAADGDTTKALCADLPTA